MGRALLLISVLTIATIGCGNNSLGSEEALVPEEARMGLVGNWRGEKQSPYSVMVFYENGNYYANIAAAYRGGMNIWGTYSVSNNVITVVTDSLRTSGPLSTSIVPGKVYSATFTISNRQQLNFYNPVGAFQTPIVPSGAYYRLHRLRVPSSPGVVGKGLIFL